MKLIGVSIIVLLAIVSIGGACERNHVLPGMVEPEETRKDNDGSGEESSNEIAPDGATVIGKITTESGLPLNGVAVSDGISVVLTNEQGEYRIKSDKSTECVFVSLPAGYMAPLKDNIPQFSQILSLSPQQLETHDFVLKKVENSKATFIVQADQHLANRANDLKQCQLKVLPDINNFIISEASRGRTVYSLTLGDISWDQFWKSNSFDLVDALKCSYEIACPIFHCIGNHDNNPYISDDWMSSAIFRKNIAPDYYSLNIAGAHIVVLDNVIYNNPGASSSAMGDRSYDRALTEREMQWLAADLAVIQDKSTPIVICAHVPFYGEPGLAGQTLTTKRNMLNTDRLEQIVAPFSNVTLLSGHYHRNYSIESPFREGMTEHNVASLSATLWWTGADGYAGNHICTDGSPGGYGILRVDNGKVVYSYKGIGYDEDYKFRVYDLNKVKIDESSVTGTQQYKQMIKDYADEYYAGSSDNGILVNLFTWQPGWEIKIEEEGESLSVSRVRTKDPLHILSYECQRLNRNAVPTATSTFTTQYSAHFFKANAKRPDTQVTVTVTDNEGNKYIQTISRPKIFSVTMK